MIKYFVALLITCSCLKGQVVDSGQQFTSGQNYKSAIEKYFWHEDFERGVLGFNDGSWLATNGGVVAFFNTFPAPLEGKFSAAITNGPAYIRYQFPRNHGEFDFCIDIYVTNVPPFSHTLALFSNGGSDLHYLYHKADGTVSWFVNAGLQANPATQFTLNRTNRVWLHAKQDGTGDIGWTNRITGLETRPTAGHPNYAASTGNVWTSFNRINLTSGVTNLVIFDNGFATDGATRLGDDPK